MEIPDGAQGEKVDFVVSSILVNNTGMLHFAIIPYIFVLLVGNRVQVSKQHLQEKEGLFQWSFPFSLLTIHQLQEHYQIVITRDEMGNVKKCCVPCLRATKDINYVL